MISDDLQKFISHSKGFLEGEDLNEDNLKIYMWPSILSGHVIVIEGPKNDVCVYGNGRFKYKVNNPSLLFWEQVMRREL